ncbi:MAG: TonB-dependent receptor [Bacteroidota bacterium]
MFGWGRYLAAVSNMQVLHGFLSLLASPNQPPRMLVTGSGHLEKPEQSVCWAATLSRRMIPAEGVSLLAALEGYYKKEADIAQSARYPAVFTVLDSNSFEVSQRFSGVKYGAGAEARLAVEAWNLALTGTCFLQHSSIRDDRSGQSHPHVTDIPFSLKLLAVYEPDRWRAAVTVQYYGGGPTTGRYYLRATNLLGGQFYFPADRELNSDRLPAYGRVDVSAARRFTLGEWELEPYLQVLNLLNTHNVSHFSYRLSPGSPDNVEAAPVFNTLPFLPSVGVRIERRW